MANEKWVADAREVLRDVERIYDDYYSRSYDQCVHDIFNAMRRIVRRHATFGFVEVKHGRWEEHPRITGYLRCSKCHDANIWDTWLENRKWNYCPNCGAKMDGDGNERE